MIEEIKSNWKPILISSIAAILYYMYESSQSKNYRWSEKIKKDKDGSISSVDVDYSFSKDMTKEEWAEHKQNLLKLYGSIDSKQEGIDRFDEDRQESVESEASRIRHQINMQFEDDED